MSKPNISKVWVELSSHYKKNFNLSIKEQFTINPKRFDEFSLRSCGIFLDYSKNRITRETIKLLIDLAETAEVIRCREEMFNGSKINITEKRAVLHTILRDINNISAPENKLVNHELNRMESLVCSVRSGKWRGYNGKVITDIVNIGIGGSDLGPAMVVNALQAYATHIKVHFVSNVDATNFTEVIKYLNPETTLFVISSKTFSTQETLINAISAREWLLGNTSIKGDLLNRHFIAVTAKPERAIKFGIHEDNILQFWDWVGGRFSLWSAIGVVIALAVGMDNFRDLLRGAALMDEHFRTAPLSMNMPVILALLSIWNINFLGISAQAIIPYNQCLSLFPAYLQQLEMESNGKRVQFDGNNVNYKTAPIVFGAVGTNSQHSFHQLLMQGTHLIPVDFLISLNNYNSISSHQLLLYANCLAQSRALMLGNTKEFIRRELRKQKISEKEIDKIIPHKIIPGNIPSNTIVVEQINPQILGSLIALYEHKVFIEGIIWQINSFDQWGVELGKQIANDLVPILQGKISESKLDCSTQGLIELQVKFDNKLT
jgi:glucose-6-phosphate isomerase